MSAGVADADVAPKWTSTPALPAVGGACTAAPGAPGGLALVSNSGGTVVLSWTAASDSPTSYVVEAGSATGASNLANVDLGSPATSLTATGVGGGTYFVRIRGKNACGTGAASNEILVVVPTPTNSLNMSRDLVRLGIAAQNLPPNDPSFDARPVFQTAVRYVQSHHIPLLTVDQGSYYFLTPQTTFAYLSLFQVSDLVVDLSGSVIYFKRAFLTGIEVTNSQRVTLTNFQTDFVDAPYTHVQLTSVDANGRRLLYQTLPGWVDPSTFSGTTTPLGNPQLWAVVFRNGLMVPGTSRMQVTDPIASGVLELLPATSPWTQSATLSTLRAGDVVVVTQRVGQAPLKASVADAITFSSISVFGSGSWAVNLEYTSNSVVDHAKVMPRPSSGLIGSNGDGIHLHHALQNNHVRNSYVTRTLDDAFAIDSLSIGRVIQQSGSRQIRVKRDANARFPNGTRVNLVDATTRESEGGIIVSQDPPDAVFPVSNGEVDLTLDRDLPTSSAGMEMVFGTADWRGAGSSIEDNTVEYVPFGRGIWISGNQGVSIQRNSIGPTSNGGIVVYQGMTPTPGPPAHDLVIQGNTVAGSLGPMASGSGSQLAIAAVMVASTDTVNAFAQSAWNTNITIRSNYVADSGRAGVWIGDLDGGAVQDNVIVRWNQHPELPYFGVSAPMQAQLMQDATHALVIRLSVNVNATNNTGGSASALAGAVSLGQTSALLPAQASRGTIIVQPNVRGLIWSAQSDADWLSIAAGQRGTGTDRVEYSVAANTTGVPRRGSITIAGVAFMITQEAASSK
ncbi:MAG: right-handed parallel beta-helix repeat-containing protein [Acidobacteria bacterium]|nr:right-handed parallel beta-helix repeat-containing protein [Acidobacteriota bacterium]